MIDPRLQVLYLLAVGVAAFVTSHPAWLLGLLGLQVVVWLGARLPAVGLLAVVRRLVAFVTFVVVSFAFFGAEPGDRLLSVVVLGWTVSVSLSGIIRGLLLSSRIVTVVVASQILQRGSNQQALVQGLRGWFVPAPIAYSLDLVLALLGSEEPRDRQVRHSQTRDATGEGPAPGCRPAAGEPHGQLSNVARRVLRGDVGFLVELMQRNIARARERAQTYGLKPEVVSDLGAIAGLGVLTMTLRFMKVMPGLPFAPGHKGLVLLPFYIVASELTVSRWGATWLGVVVGLTSFLSGEGRFGPFEILRHVTPGLFVDLMMPLVRALRPAPGPWLYALVGAGAAVTRLSTLLLVAYLVGAPSIFYTFLVPMLVSNTVFGFLSGFVTFHVMKSIDRLRAVL